MDELDGRGVEQQFARLRILHGTPAQRKHLWNLRGNRGGGVGLLRNREDQPANGLVFERTKPGLAMAGKQLGDGAPGLRLDQGIRILKLPSGASGEQPAHGCLPCPHEAGQGKQ